MAKRMFIAIVTMVLAATAFADQKDKADSEVTILVTAVPTGERTRAIADRLQPSDFAVRENKVPQKVISAKRVSDQPATVAVLIQDDLVMRVNNELNVIREFIRSLPEGSRVMVGYISAGSFQVRQDFTTDLNKAADSLRILLSSDIASPASPFEGLAAALKKFDGQPGTRRMALLVSDGFDAPRGFRTGGMYFSLELDRAIESAQLRSVSVFTMFAPSVGPTSVRRVAAYTGQNSLLRLADRTGGDSFFAGSDFVTFDPYFRDFRELMRNQWQVTYRSTNKKKGYRSIEVTTDFDIDLHHPAGYNVK